jgi:hypothetical protein
LSQRLACWTVDHGYTSPIRIVTQDRQVVKTAQMFYGILF